MSNGSWKVPATMVVAGIICGVMLWIAFGLVAIRQGGNPFTLESFVGSCIGGVITGFIMHLLG